MWQSAHSWNPSREFLEIPRSGTTKGKGKNYGNSVHLPVFKGSADDTLVLDITPPPELHLMIGVVNKLFDEMTKEWPEGANRWVKECYVQKEAYHGATFNGNSARKLIKHTDMLESYNPPEAGKRYIETFKIFNDVVEGCFGPSLQKGFKDKICEFKSKYMRLQISVTPKVHCVMHHVALFCESHDSGLGFFSEQASESVHRDFWETWLRYKVGHDHPSFARRIFRAVTDYNTRHL